MSESSDRFKSWLEMLKVLVAVVVALAGIFVFNPARASREASMFLNTAVNAYLNGIEDLKTDSLLSGDPDVVLGPWERRLSALRAAADTWNDGKAGQELMRFVEAEQGRLDGTRTKLNQKTAELGRLAQEQQDLSEEKSDVEVKIHDEQALPAPDKEQLGVLRDKLSTLQTDIQKSVQLAQNVETELVGDGYEQLLSGLPARVYIHINEERQREGARNIQLRLQELGIVVPGIENIRAGGKRGWVPPVSELRYSPSRAEEPEAERITQAIRDEFELEIRTLFVKSNAARTRHFELWLNAEAFLPAESEPAEVSVGQ